MAESPDSKRPAVYAKPHPDYTILDVYGPFTPAERSQIITLVMQIRADKGSKPIHVHFYPRHLDQTELVHQVVIP